MADTVLGNVIEFFGRLGVFDVVLPFLLVFTMVFAVLERTKVLGTEGKEKNARKNLNAMVAFVIAFLVLASSRLVEAITSVSSNVVILITLGIFFLLTMGAFYEQGMVGEKGLPSGWLRTFFLTIMIVGIIVIFMNALKVESGDTWWDVSIDYLRNNWSSTAFASIVLIIGVVAFMYYLTSERTTSESGKGKEGGG